LNVTASNGPGSPIGKQGIRLTTPNGTTRAVRLFRARVRAGQNANAGIWQVCKTGQEETWREEPGAGILLAGIWEG